jgi:hypothetical protein
MLYFLFSIGMYVQAHMLLLAEVLSVLIQGDGISKYIPALNRGRVDSVPHGCHFKDTAILTAGLLCSAKI